MKKIDTKKSTILGINGDDHENLKLGIKGYFSHYSDFEPYIEGELDGFTHSQCMTIERDPNGCSSEQWYNYFIPEDKVVFKEEKPKKLRPYKDISEFCNETGCEEIGRDIIIIRNKINEQEQVLLYIGYSDDTVHLGGHLITLKALFENYEFLYEDKWLPFGIEE